MSFDPGAWYPVAAADDLPYRHVYHGQLWGREMAVWRADDGNVNIWENRCLHRGVRLTVGLNEGGELRCLYHGWRYANRSAGCTYIPAHPADAPARTICNRTFAIKEAAGLIWSSLDPQTEFTAPEGAFVLRAIPVNASPAFARQIAISAGYSGDKDDFASPLLAEGIALYTQPLDADRVVLRGVLMAAPEDSMAALRRWNQKLTQLRAQIENAVIAGECPPPIEVTFAPVDEELARMPALSRDQTAHLRVTIARKYQVAADVVALELRALNGVLPAAQPGCHIDVTLPGGLLRQYSVINAPGETDHYTIGVKLEQSGQGGSRAIHQDLREGDLLSVSAPRNNFPLRRDAEKTVLVAGGIGLTPMLAMAQTLAAQNLKYELHVFARSDEHIAFGDRLKALGASVIRHIGLDSDATAQALRQVMQGYGFSHHLYLCGPAPMLELARGLAAGAGWPEEAVHFEYFANATEVDRSSSFEIALARSALTLQVPAGKSILDVLRENDVAMPSSCGQGACGTCIARVLEGEVDHQDVFLTPSERAANGKIATCVSRAKSGRLVLDI